MAEPPPRRKGMGKRAAAATAAGAVAPCGACKFLRRKCTTGCIFAPHFGSDQGAARFAAVHKVFGASNVSKLLQHIPISRRHDAVVTISYEAQARLSDPVYGCVSTILALQQQIASVQAELAMVQAQLMSSRLAMANALQTTHFHHQPPQQPQWNQNGLLQPAYSNNSSASNTLVNLNGSFVSTYDLATDPAPSPHHSFELLQLSRPPKDEDEDEEESRNNITTLANHIMHPR